MTLRALLIPPRPSGADPWADPWRGCPLNPHENIIQIALIREIFEHLPSLN